MGETIATKDAPAETTTEEATEPAAETTPSPEKEAPAPTDSAETKTDDAPEDAGESKDQEPAGPPEKYEFTMPDGVTIEDGMLKVAEETFKSQGFSQEQAQSMIDLQVQVNEQQAQVWADTVSDWDKVTREDTEIGGDKFDATAARVQRMVAEYGSPALTEWLELGFGNHTELIRFVDKMARAMGEETSTPGSPNQAAQTENDYLRKRFPTMFDEDGNPKK